MDIRFLLLLSKSRDIPEADLSANYRPGEGIMWGPIFDANFDHL